MDDVNVYLIPGLGADRRMYYPQLKVVPQAKVLEFIPPVKGETLSQYAARLAEGIDTSKPFILIGTSLGGMLALEVTNYTKPQKVVLIATIKNRNEMPLFISSMKYLRLHKLIRGSMYKYGHKIVIWFLASRRGTEAENVIRDMAKDASPVFIEWAVNAVVNWQPQYSYNGSLTHIHGTKDLMFPIRRIKEPFVIKNGSHVMNITMGTEVNKALLEALKTAN
jgi:pimeloyl-ACP methyl ester carboxylesterase